MKEKPRRRATEPIRSRTLLSEAIGGHHDFHYGSKNIKASPGKSYKTSAATVENNCVNARVTDDRYGTGFDRFMRPFHNSAHAPQNQHYWEERRYNNIPTISNNHTDWRSKLHEVESPGLPSFGADNPTSYSSSHGDSYYSAETSLNGVAHGRMQASFLSNDNLRKS